MPYLPRALARFNRVVFNRVIGPFAARLPGFGVIVHRGRRTGREYRVPVNVFPTTHGYVIALTYGPDADWVKNVLAAGGCVLETKGRRVELTAPRRFHDQARRDVRIPERQILRLAGMDEFLELQVADHESAGSGRDAAD